ncbi:MAG: ligase-associated DNA damage response endonuclease PdeM [Paracoccaceae bacterium]
MNGYAFPFAGLALVALPSGALYAPDLGALLVSDLHLGKSERLARRGGVLLPPYETRETLTRLSDDLDRTQAKSLIALGDSFDDLAAADSLDDADRMTLHRLIAGRDWTWVEGNHDAGAHAFGGTHRAEARLGPLTCRHIASTATPEISGHYHPKARLGGTARPCFLIDAQRIIMPAYGAYTGGLYCDDATITALMQPTAIAVLTGAKAIPCPMPRTTPKPADHPFKLR